MDQPRVPAGNPRGGQWTKDGSLSDLSVAARDKLEEFLDQADENLPEQAQKAITDFVGHDPKARIKGEEFGIMWERTLEDAFSKNPSNRGVVVRGELEAAMTPVREELRKTIGDRIEVFRAGDATDRGTRNVLSYTMDENFVKFHARVGKDIPVYSEEEITKLVSLGRAGKPVEIGIHVLKPSKEFPGTFDLFTKEDDYGPESYVTDSPGVRSQANDYNSWAKEKNAENAARRATISSRSVPVEDIVWATNRAGQWEVIVRTKPDKKGYF